MFSLLGFMLLIALALWVRSVSLEQRRMAEQLALLRRELDRLPAGGAAESGAGTGDELAEPRRDAPESTGAGPETEGSEPKAAEAADAARLSADAAAGRAETGGAGPERRDEDDTGLPEAAVLAASSPGKGMDLESLIGGRWSALLGGLAVALGVLFLARYSIEAGLLGPRARMTMGTLMSLALFGAGEFMRRRDRQDAMPTLTSADIPGILTGAGAIGAFGTIYAAYALYGFVGPAVAFVGLTVLGIASLLLSAVHGPKLAALGLVGAYVSPLLVSSQDPNPVAFGAHILVVTAAVMGVARIRGWRWLAIGGIAGSTALALLLLTISTLTAWFALGLLLVALFAVHVISLVAGVEARPDPLEDRPAARLAIGAGLSVVLVGVLAILTWDTQVPLLLLVSGLAALMVAAGGIWPSLSPVAPLSVVLIVVALLSLRIDFPVIAGITSGLDIRDGLMAPDLGGFVRNSLLMAVPSFLLAVFLGLRAAASAPIMAGRLAIALSAITVLTMAAIYLSVAPFETHVPTGLAALALSAMMVGLTEKFGRARPDDWSAAAPAWLAVGAVALAGLAVAILLTRQWMPLGFAVTAAGACLIHGRRSVPALGWLAVALSLLASSGLYFNAPFSADVIGSAPFFNWLVVIIALPAALLIWGGLALRGSGGRRPGELVIAFGLALAGLFVALELRHFIAGGDITGAPFGLIDMATQSIAALCFSVGLQWAARRSDARVFPLASLVVGALGIAAMVIGLIVVFNPFLSQAAVGEGRVFNLLLPGYLIPGLLAALTAYLASAARPRWYRIGYGATGAILLFIYVSLMVRHGFQGERVGFLRSTSDAEIWAYSVAWLIMGGCTLALGLVLRSLPLRAASAAVISLTVAKVFLIDMSALTGALRAFSFIGLGVSLMVIGRFYQRVLLRTGNRSADKA
ncbi:DUF2339 domain-containing protein [Hoeflea sp. EC-HK425]|uniref:DUF2339 domain-containing protein n=1 Tax=Hoeflea sp. EC-HK425 TaxID=2038388 RepID=UPI001257A4AE|nr:DUF2339 domain-containing protein [Hoeflea sp. EC-HK425]VVT08473.1 conserved membrane hypothetical protein [Hoeflea sp. EC-HK425]